MIEYQEESLIDVLEEMMPLVIEHHEEVDDFKDKITLNPDYDRYLEIAGQDMLTLYTMRKDSELVGYNMFIVGSHGHYSDTLYAVNDIIYIDPKMRGEEATPTFFKRCEEWLTEYGVDVIMYSMKSDRAAAGLMDHLGYKEFEVNYRKVLV
jgi:hypothetical protein